LRRPFAGSAAILNRIDLHGSDNPFLVDEQGQHRGSGKPGEGAAKEFCIQPYEQVESLAQFPLECNSLKRKEITVAPIAVTQLQN
jgi:hypothetical protein